MKDKGKEGGFWGWQNENENEYKQYKILYILLPFLVFFKGQLISEWLFDVWNFQKFDEFLP